MNMKKELEKQERMKQAEKMRRIMKQRELEARRAAYRASVAAKMDKVGRDISTEMEALITEKPIKQALFETDLSQKEVVLSPMQNEQPRQQKSHKKTAFKQISKETAFKMRKKRRGRAA